MLTMNRYGSDANIDLGNWPLIPESKHPRVRKVKDAKLYAAVNHVHIATDVAGAASNATVATEIAPVDAESSTTANHMRMSATTATSDTNTQLSKAAIFSNGQINNTKPHLVTCIRNEEYLLPIAKYFTIHRLMDGFNGVPPWNATAYLLMDDPYWYLCQHHEYVQEALRRREMSPLVNVSKDDLRLFRGQWIDGVYFPNYTNKTTTYMRSIQDRPVLMRARGEVFWRYADTSCSDVDFIWDRQIETPSEECFTVHYLQGVSGSYARDNKGELGYEETTAIYEGSVRHPQKPNDTHDSTGLNYTNFCSYLIRADPGNLTNMFREKHYDIDVMVRHAFVRQISEYKPCERLIECPGNPHTAYKCFMGYKFHITMENSLVDGYVSEKLFNGALGGGIPIYFGASNVGSYINQKSIVHCNINRSVIEEMRAFYPRSQKSKRTFLFNNTAYWPTEEELWEFANGYLRKELEPCFQRVMELDTNDTAFREVLEEPFITDSNIMNGMYPLRGIERAIDTLLTRNANAEKKIVDSSRGITANVKNSRLSNQQQEKMLCPWDDNDDIVNSPCDLQLLLRHLISRIPFSYAHFNDGEMRSLQLEKGKTDRGMQALSPRLKETMQHAFYQNASGLVYGLPCRNQFESAHNFAMENLKNYTNVKKTQANLFIDGNYQVSRNVLLTYLRKVSESRSRDVYMVVGDSADMSLFYRKTGIQNDSMKVMRVPSKNAFPEGYDNIIQKWKEFQPHDIVIICAGPLGRILAVEWFLAANRTTYLELGSFFDMDLYGKSFGASYYLGGKNFANCNDPTDTIWQVQKERLLGMIDD